MGLQARRYTRGPRCAFPLFTIGLRAALRSGNRSASSCVVGEWQKSGLETRPTIHGVFGQARRIVLDQVSTPLSAGAGLFGLSSISFFSRHGLLSR